MIDPSIPEYAQGNNAMCWNMLRRVCEQHVACVLIYVLK
jgi:hypothetical protein